MSRLNQIAWDDTVLPFQLDLSGVRGRVARLDGVLEHILSRHDYPPAVAAAVAEIALLTALIGPTLKLRWKLSLQVRGTGPIRTLACDWYAPETEGEAGRMRAWASFDAVRRGDTIGTRHDGTPVQAPGDGFIVFPNANASPGNEWFYFARPGTRALGG